MDGGVRGRRTVSGRINENRFAITQLGRQPLPVVGLDQSGIDHT
jgi:hypothetical protein